ncbi:MAG: M2 family metallopeptidase [Ignavibacteriales bacterium]|nr:M2 family metallopeptidase [Ignavibacteriales bacterium]
MNFFHVLSKFLIVLLFLFVACQPSVQQEAQQFLDTYTTKYLELSYAYSLAEWNSNTRIVEGDETNANTTKKARAEFSAFTGSKANIETAQRFLEQKDRLTPLQVKQFERILYLAADNPEMVEEIVEERIAAETKQTEALYGFEFKIGGKPVTTNRIDEILRTSANLKERRAAWEASKNVGTVLKDGLDNLRRLRNATVKPLGYSSYFAYQVSDYGMTVQEMMELMDKLNRELRPLYRELHTYARYELAKKYRQPVPDMLPADWLPNRWGQDWSAMVSVEGMDIDASLKDKTPEWIVKQAEEFYVSLGWPALPRSFWDRSSLYPLPEGAAYKKNNHASAWHLDLQNDLRSLMSVEPNAEWYETTHHELGHVYYFISYTNPDVPPLLREGANRGYHEAIGSMIGLASMQKPFLEGRGIAPKEAKVDPVQALLKEALNYAVFIPFSTGTMSHFEHELYEKNLPKDQYNAKWWEIVKEYQGIIPPTSRGEQYCDAATKTHINDDAAQYYDYALSYVLLFQLHDHIATTILKQDPRVTDYYGSKEVGEFLKKIMTPGASRDWRIVLKGTTGEDLNANAMLRYFEPLMKYLQDLNKGRKHTI